ncbi:EamA family transporter [Streptomyces sp. NPDC051310]|uniref:EamA family transporter n=1 Tax=Streptomyces sp. NPDC051310 TaxID=3365649 RepID=UPI0037B336EE
MVALLSAPYGIARAGSALLDPDVLGIAAIVAVASSALPYTLNLEALRRIPPRVFSVLTSLEPAAGAVFGLLILGQRLGPAQWGLGIAAVVGASTITTLAGTRGRQTSPGPGSAYPSSRPGHRSTEADTSAAARHVSRVKRRSYP